MTFGVPGWRLLGVDVVDTYGEAEGSTIAVEVVPAPDGPIPQILAPFNRQKVYTTTTLIGQAALGREPISVKWTATLLLGMSRQDLVLMSWTCT